MIRIIGYSADDEAYLRHGGCIAPSGIKRKYVSCKKNIKNFNRLHCCYCKRQLNEDNYTIDHVIPLARNGTNSMKNKRQCCFECNQDKADYLLSEWLVLLQERQLTLHLGTDECRLNQRKIGRVIHYIQLI